MPSNCLILCIAIHACLSIVGESLYFLPGTIFLLLTDQLWGDPVEKHWIPFRKPGFASCLHLWLFDFGPNHFKAQGLPLRRCWDASSFEMYCDFLFHWHCVLLPDSLIIERWAGGPECSHNSLVEKKKTERPCRYLEPSLKAGLLEVIAPRALISSKEWMLSYFRLIYNLMILFFWRDSWLWTCLGGTWPADSLYVIIFLILSGDFSLNVEHTRPLTRKHQ